MNKYILLIAFLGLQLAASAQLNIRVTPNPAHGTGTIDEPDVKVDVTILNTSAQTVDLIWVRDVIDVQDGWFTYICDAQNCYEPEDSICPETAQNIIEPGNKIEFQVHVLSGGIEGLAAVNVDFFDRSDPQTSLATLQTTFEVSETSAADDPFSSADLKIYPNPTSDYFRIFQSDNVAHVDVYNMVGRQVKQFTAKKDGQYDISNLPEGMYVVRLLSKESAVLKTLRLSKS